MLQTQAILNELQVKEQHAQLKESTSICLSRVAHLFLGKGIQ